MLLEKNKNRWHNNGGRDYHIKFDQEAEHHDNGSRNPNLPPGKIGDAVAEIIEVEVVYVSLALKYEYDWCNKFLK